MSTPTGEVTALLQRWSAGHRDAETELFAYVYKELRRLAGYHIRVERVGHTLQPTALVHEVYLRLFGGETVPWENRNHFLAIASRAMRRVLVDHARTKQAEKRGGDVIHVSLTGKDRVESSSFAEMLDVHKALDKLAASEPRQAQVVEMRYFGGLSVDETAEALGVSPKTVKRDWAMARVYLYNEIHPTPP